MTVVVSPWTTTQSGFSASSTCADAGERARGQRVERLAGGHQVEIVMRLDRGDLEHLVEHPAVLRRYADARDEARSSASSAWISGNSLIASGRVPNTVRIVRGPFIATALAQFAARCQSRSVRDRRGRRQFGVWQFRLALALEPFEIFLLDLLDAGLLFGGQFVDL